MARITESDISTGNQLAESLMGCCGNGEFGGFKVIPERLSVMQAQVTLGLYTDFIAITKSCLNKVRIEEGLKALYHRYQNQ